jgi:hypothetical protein
MLFDSNFNLLLKTHLEIGMILKEFRPTKFDKDKFKKANNNAASIDPRYFSSLSLKFFFWAKASDNHSLMSSQTLPRMLSHSSRVKLDQNDEDLMNAILQETL